MVGILESNVHFDLWVIVGAATGACYFLLSGNSKIQGIRRLGLTLISCVIGIFSTVPFHRILNAITEMLFNVDIPNAKPIIALLVSALAVWFIESIKSGRIKIGGIFRGKNTRDDE